MIARTIILFFTLFATFFVLIYGVTRTRFFNARRVAEIVKNGSIAFLAALIAAMVIGVLLALSNL